MALGSSQTNIKAVITADDRASQTLKNFGNNASKIGGVVKNGLKIASAAFIAAGTAAIAFGAFAVKAFTDTEDAIAQTNAVLKSTKGIAGVTAAAVDKLANSLQATTKYGDEEVRSAENLLLTFTSIGKDIFPQATKTVLDMSTALGQDLKSSSIQLGKALQDPILGVTALRRVGVNFSSAQQDVIKKLVDTGQKAKAQQLILKELNTEFGGSAVAAGKTFNGSLIILKNQLIDVTKIVGVLIVNAIKPFILKATEFVKAVDWQDVVQRSIDAITNLANTIYNIGKTVADYLVPKFMGLGKSLNENIIPILKDLWKNVIEPLIPVIGTALVVAIGAAVDAIKILSDFLGGLYKGLKDGNLAVLLLVGSLTALATALAIGKAISLFTTALNIMSTTTIPAVILKMTVLQGLVSTPMIMPAIAIGAALGAIAAVMDAYNRMQEAVKGAKDARANLAELTDKTNRHFIQVYNDGVSSKVQKAKAKEFLHKAGVPGYATGGYTGSGSTNEPAGIVHKGEYVIPKSGVDQSTGTPKMGGNLTLNVNIGLYTGSEMEKRKVAMEIFKSLQDVARSQSMSVGKMLGV